MGRLDVRICAAKNLPDDQVVSKPDPYVKMKLENQVHRTSVVDNKTNPEWNEVFKFTVADPDSAQLKLELWNANVISDEFMGEYHLSLAGLTKKVVKDDWYILKQCKTNAELRVRMCAQDFGAEPPAEQPEPNMMAPMQGGYPAPAPGGMPPPQQPVAPPPPPPQPYAQPQWGAPVAQPGAQKCEVHDKKSGFGGFMSKVGSAVSGVATMVTGAHDAAPKPSQTHIDDNTGFMYLHIDNGLRLIPSAAVYTALFNKEPKPEDFQHFRGPQHPNNYRILAPLPNDCHIFRAGSGSMYLYDLLPPQCTTYCRRLVHETAWKYYDFGTGHNLKTMDAMQAQALVDGDPIHAPMA